MRRLVPAKAQRDFAFEQPTPKRVLSPEERVAHLPESVRPLATAILHERQGIMNMLNEIVVFRRIVPDLPNEDVRARYEQNVTSLLSSLDRRISLDEYEKIARQLEEIREPIRGKVKTERTYETIAINRVHSALKQYDVHRMHANPEHIGGQIRDVMMHVRSLMRKPEKRAEWANFHRTAWKRAEND